MLHYEEYFGVYFSVYPQGNHWMLAEAKKAIDFLHEYPQE